MREVRHAGPSDAQSLIALYTHLIPDEASVSERVAAERIAALKAYPGSEILIASVDGKDVATLTLIVVPNMTRQGAPYAFFDNVVTHQAHRRQGHVIALLAKAEEAAWAAGCYRIMIVSGNHNETAHQVYAAAGFDASKTGFQKRRIPTRPQS